MAANFWTSSHYKQLLDQEEVGVVHPLDKERGMTLEDFKLIKLHMSNYIARLAPNVKVRQRRSMTEYDPRVVAPTCLYLASKAEESTVQARLLVFYINKLHLKDPVCKCARNRGPCLRWSFKTVSRFRSFSVIRYCKVGTECESVTKGCCYCHYIHETCLCQIISNTTIQRPDPVSQNPVAAETRGGLSGKPLFSLSTNMLEDMYILTKEKYDGV